MARLFIMDIIQGTLFIGFILYTIVAPCTEIYFLSISNSTQLDQSKCYSTWDDILFIIVINMINTILYIINLLHLALSDNPICCLCNIYKSNVYDRALTSVNYSPVTLTMGEKVIHVVILGLYFISHLWLFIPFVDGVLIVNNNCTDLHEVESISNIIIFESFVFMFYLIFFIGLVISWYCINTNMICDAKCETLSMYCKQSLCKNNNNRSDKALSFI